MMNISNKYLAKFGITEFGWLEFFFSFCLVIIGYKYGLYLLIIMSIYSYIKKQRILKKPIMLFFLLAYIILHEIFVSINNPTSQTSALYTNLFSSIVCISSIFFITPSIKYERMRSMLNLVAIIISIGLFYHAILLLSGRLVTPIEIPFLSQLGENPLLHKLNERPVSFCWEPASCATILMVPFFINLLERRFFMVVFIMFAIFVSSSTTGIALSSIVISVYILMDTKTMKYKIFGTALLIFMGYLLFNTEVFSYGRDKILLSSIEHNTRTGNGEEIVQYLNNSQILVGVSNATAYDFVIEEGINTDSMFFQEKSIYITTFWLFIIKYGLIGLLIYLSIYYYYYKICIRLLPFLIAISVALFTQAVMVGPMFFYQFVFLSVFSTHLKINR